MNVLEDEFSEDELSSILYSNLIELKETIINFRNNFLYFDWGDREFLNIKDSINSLPQSKYFDFVYYQIKEGDFAALRSPKRIMFNNFIIKYGLGRFIDLPEINNIKINGEYHSPFVLECVHPALGNRKYSGKRYYIQYNTPLYFKDYNNADIEVPKLPICSKFGIFLELPHDTRDNNYGVLYIGTDFPVDLDILRSGAEDGEWEYEMCNLDCDNIAELPDEKIQNASHIRDCIPCMGGYKQEVEVKIDNGDLRGAILTIITFIQTLDFNDEWGRYAKLFS